MEQASVQGKRKLPIVKATKQNARKETPASKIPVRTVAKGAPAKMPKKETAVQDRVQQDVNPAAPEEPVDQNPKQGGPVAPKPFVLRQGVEWAVSHWNNTFANPPPAQGVPPSNLNQEGKKPVAKAKASKKKTAQQNEDKREPQKNFWELFLLQNWTPGFARFLTVVVILVFLSVALWYTLHTVKYVLATIAGAFTPSVPVTEPVVEVPKQTNILKKAFKKPNFKSPDWVREQGFII